MQPTRSEMAFCADYAPGPAGHDAGAIPRFLPFMRGKCLVHGAAPASLAWRKPADFPANFDLAAAAVRLRPAANVFAVDLTDASGLGLGLCEEGDRYVDMLTAAFVLPPPISATAGRAASLLHSRRRQAYCGVCGNLNGRLEGTRCSNRNCGEEWYPQVNPVVMMLPVSGDSCLLARQPGFPQGYLAPLAGFIEPGETIEHAARREVMEEVGLIADWVTYVLSQPWPFPSSLMIACLVDVGHGEPDLGSGELESARWMSNGEIGQLLAGSLIDGVRIPPKPIIGHHLIAHWFSTINGD